jgi:uncharacterized protein YkwD
MSSRPVLIASIVLGAATALPSSAPAARRHHHDHDGRPAAHHHDHNGGTAAHHHAGHSAAHHHAGRSTAHHWAAHHRRNARRTSAAVAPVAPAVSLTTPCPGAVASALITPTPALRAAVLCLVDQQREIHGLPGLSDASNLDAAAQNWTDTMVSTGVFAHGASWAQRLIAAGYDWLTAGENIATGYATPVSLVAGWMASQGHCQNILNPKYADTGIGVNPRPALTSVPSAATWTEDFGLLSSRPAPSMNTAPMDGCPYT